ncbi:Lipid II flippase FtsW [Caloramator mitchellensis]|uniref:Probable peptidoglycan glycosyltransferase FtsW n=1 Tax=Caloramator mitchellensis TaxID=908809 RepID=A0A0R3JU87_CALMK|nr:stage V sporulation protein E [Caloramator mitchellensis]KRQ86586.1 Lipid II flippase FtsW [Caloramator mitchellensis]
MSKKRPYDFILFAVIIVLLAFGINMVFSASMYIDKELYRDSFYHFKKQAVWAGLGLIAMFFTSKIDYKIYKNRKIIAFGMIVTIVLLVIVLFLPAVKGAKRWIGIGSFGIQPSELAKLMLVIYTADNLSRKGDKVKKFTKGVVPILLVAGLFAGLIIAEPNMSTSVIIVATAFAMLFVSGAEFWHLALLFLSGVGLGVVGILAASYRFRRFTAFLNPWADPLGDGYQAIQSLYALGAGGLFGVGFGQSRQKNYYIPEAQNDFIFSIIGEELGFIGVFFVILLFTILVWRGIKIALNCKDKFGTLLATGITSLLAIQTSINFLVVSSSMPVTGVTLPLISYGGSSLVFTLASLGILLNISRDS